MNEVIPVLYLAAEGGDNGLKLRCKNFGITNDKAKFICRTLSQGPMFGLDDPKIEALVRSMRPMVVLETMVRFGDGEDEDDAKESNKLAGALFRLISYGARAVIAIHHSRKDIKQKGASLELAVRGSGDYAAMADVIWTVVRDEKLYQDGTGPNEINLFGWGRDFNPYPMRLALTEKAPEGTPILAMWKPGLISCIDQTGDLKWVDRGAAGAAAGMAEKDSADRLELMVQDNPNITLAELAKQTGISVWAVNAALKAAGWSKPSGRAKKGNPHRWVKADGGQRAAAS